MGDSASWAADLQTWTAEALGKERAGNLGGALLVYRRILSRDPGEPGAWCKLGVLLHTLGREDEALEACARALELAPGDPVAVTSLGNVLDSLGDLEGAMARFRQALALDPRNLAATANLAGVLGRLGRLEEALEGDRAALALAPGHPSLTLNLGHTLLRLGRLPEAEAAFQGVLAGAPSPETTAMARWNLAYLRLLQGRFGAAWPDFGARLEVPGGRDNLRGFPQPAWDGAPFPGRTLLVWVEQGLGDTLQFARYLPAVKALGGTRGTVLFQTYAILLGLLLDTPGADRVLSEHDDLPAFDLQVPLLELPALFGGGPEAFPAPSALRPPPGHEPPPALATLLASSSAGGPVRKAGLVWAGSAHHQDDVRRSLDPALLAPLGRVPGVRWFSLQVGAKEPPPLPGLVDLGAHFRDFSDTAWALAHLDLVVTVDTAVAHLAGSMGLPVHLLLPFFPDWRWQLEGRTTPWYPTVILHRQPAPGTWAPVLAQLAGELT